MKRNRKSPPKFNYHSISHLINTMQNLKHKRQSYVLQILKQFILFPNDLSDSSQKSISRYDKLIFSDDVLHTMFKKLQTKMIENKIWGFINIRMHPYIQAANKIGHHIKRLKKKTQQQHKIITFYQIRTYAFSKDIIHNIEINRNNQFSQKQSQKSISSHTNIKIKQTIQIPSRPPNPKMAIINNQNSVRQRSKSGSLVRYQYDLQNCKRILLNGQIIPCKINVKRSQSPLRAPEYIKLQKSTQKQCQRIRYIGKSRDQLSKLQNRNLQYQTPLSNKHIRQPSPQNARIIYVQRLPLKYQNQQNYNRGKSGISPKSSQKIIRLNSANKNRASSYLDHLHS